MKTRQKSACIIKKKHHLNNKVLEIFYYFHHFSKAPYFHKNIISGGLMDLQLYTNQ